VSDVNACQRQADAHDLRSRSHLPSCSGLVKIFLAPSRTKNWQKGARWRVMQRGTSHACMQASSTSRSQEARQMSKWAQARLCFAVQRKPHSSEAHSAARLKTALAGSPRLSSARPRPSAWTGCLTDQGRCSPVAPPLLPQTSGPRRLRRQPLARGLEHAAAARVGSRGRPRTRGPLTPAAARHTPAA